MAKANIGNKGQNSGHSNIAISGNGKITLNFEKKHDPHNKLADNSSDRYKTLWLNEDEMDSFPPRLAQKLGDFKKALNSRRASKANTNDAAEISDSFNSISFSSLEKKLAPHIESTKKKIREIAKKCKSEDVEMGEITFHDGDEISHDMSNNISIPNKALPALALWSLFSESNKDSKFADFEHGMAALFTYLPPLSHYKTLVKEMQDYGQNIGASLDANGMLTKQHIEYFYLAPFTFGLATQGLDFIKSDYIMNPGNVAGFMDFQQYSGNRGMLELQEFRENNCAALKAFAAGLLNTN